MKENNRRKSCPFGKSWVIPQFQTKAKQFNEWVARQASAVREPSSTTWAAPRLAPMGQFLPKWEVSPVMAVLGWAALQLG